MTVKLNLTIKEETANLIKAYAKKRKTSVSKITEDLYEPLIKKNTIKTKKKSFVEKYAGIIKDIKINDIGKARDEYLKEKYGI